MSNRIFDRRERFVSSLSEIISYYIIILLLSFPTKYKSPSTSFNYQNSSPNEGITVPSQFLHLEEYITRNEPKSIAFFIVSIKIF